VSAVGSIHFVTTAVHLVVTLHPETFARRAGASPAAVGQALARVVDAAVRREGLGYYPALGYFREVGGVEESLLEAVASLAWLATEMAEDEVRRRLRQVFSRVDVESTQPVAFTLPPVRPSQEEALARLARHYTPDTLKVALRLTSLQKQQAPVGMEQFVRRTLWRWLRERFAALDIASARLL
jgi:hypothetical protein